MPVAYWKIVGPYGAFARRYQTVEEADALREKLTNPNEHFLRAYNEHDKIVYEEVDGS